MAGPLNSILQNVLQSTNTLRVQQESIDHNEISKHPETCLQVYSTLSFRSQDIDKELCSRLVVPFYHKARGLNAKMVKFSQFPVIGL